MLRAFATGRVAYYADFWTYPAWSIFQLLVVPYWRDFHFYWIHRMMHRWRTTTIPDVGQWLYTHVHSLHHKSYNTGPLSGLSMHPVEHLIYYTCTLLPFVFLLVRSSSRCSDSLAAQSLTFQPHLLRLSCALLFFLTSIPCIST